ncbi:hypothetical protein DPMN_049714 [Dreissena polymorpha]|uniref:Uncharacterized protein n=1 Tax=Dreissena polymorpha TaxID=45954 RepID=A0A9D4CFW0_DREPO|nr:hypothetical protein DPMN_049714 [Dreissena polymorpha]
MNGFYLYNKINKIQKYTEGVYLRPRSDGSLLQKARLKANNKLREVMVREMLFSDDASLVTQT